LQKGKKFFLMGNMNGLRQVFLEELLAHGWTQKAFARKARVSGASITKFVQGSFPQDTLFRAIFQSWPRAETRRRLLNAYIADEMRRAGFTLEKDAPESVRQDVALEKDLAVVERAMRSEPTLREFIRRTARIFSEKRG
jgi:transcriptional regulator with XRE-family HTH domain